MKIGKVKRSYIAARLALLFVLTSTWSAADEATFVTTELVIPALEPILSAALKQSPRVVSRNLDLLAAEYSAMVSASRMYPQVGGSVVYDLQTGDRGGQSGVYSERFLYDFSATYPLFHWGAVRAGVEVGRIQAAIASNNVVETYRLLALEVRREFLQLVIAKSSLRNAQFALEQQNKRLELLRIQIDAGEAAQGALAGMEVAVKEAALLVDRGQQGFDAAGRRFQRLTGAGEFDAESIPEEIPPPTVISGELTSALREEFVQTEGFMEQPNHANAALAIKREKLNEAIWRVNQRPKFNLRTGISQDELSYELDVSRRSRISALFVGFNVTWNIFDGHATRGYLRASQTRIQQLKNGLVELEQDLLEGAAVAAHEVDFTGRALEIAEIRYSWAQSGLQLTEESLQLGLVSSDAVKNAQAAVYAAQVVVFSARAAYLNAVAAFLSSVNADPIVESLGERLNRP